MNLVIQGDDEYKNLFYGKQNGLSRKFYSLSHPLKKEIVCLLYKLYHSAVGVYLIDENDV